MQFLTNTRNTDKFLLWKIAEFGDGLPPFSITYYMTFHLWLTPRKECDTNSENLLYMTIITQTLILTKSSFYQVLPSFKEEREIIKKKKTKKKTKMWRSVTKWFLSAAEFQWRREEIGIGLEEHFSKQHNSIRLWLFSTFFYHLHSVLGWIQICQNIRVYLSNSNFYLETSESLSIF